MSNVLQADKSVCFPPFEKQNASAGPTMTDGGSRFIPPRGEKCQGFQHADFNSWRKNSWCCSVVYFSDSSLPSNLLHLHLLKLYFPLVLVQLVSLMSPVFLVFLVFFGGLNPFWVTVIFWLLHSCTLLSSSAFCRLPFYIYAFCMFVFLQFGL